MTKNPRNCLSLFCYLMQSVDSLEQTLMLGKIEGGRRRGRQRMRCLDTITNSMDVSLVNSRSWWWTGKPSVLKSMGSQRVVHDWETELNWTDAEAEASIHWPPDAKNWFIGTDPDAGKDWRQEEKGTTENEMVGWHHWLGGHEFEQSMGGGDGQGSLVCCNPWSLKYLDTTEEMNWTEILQSCLRFSLQSSPSRKYFLLVSGRQWEWRSS